RQLFTDLATESLNAGWLPAIDAAFRTALTEKDGESSWTRLMRQNVRQLLAQQRHVAAITLARQGADLEDQPRGNEVLAATLDQAGGGADRLFVRLLAVNYFRNTQQTQRADQLLQHLP